VVGRFGVGFAAVLAVTDEPRLLSTSGGVAWSATRTREAVGGVPALAEALAARSGAVPVLRLPWPAEGAPPAGYDTAVVLEARDRAAAALLRQQLGEVDAGLLLMLPALSEVVVEVDGDRRVLTAADLDVRQVAAAGPLDPALLADRPTEERRATTWWVRWALPRPAGVPAVLHAPTPTDEPVDLPALLLASVPLDPSRRHVAPGPLCDTVVGHAAAAYARLVLDVAADGAPAAAVMALLPGPLPGGQLDAALRRAVVDRLRDTAFLPGRLTPAEALAVDGLPDAALPVLAPAVVGLLPPQWARCRELDRLGVRRCGLADLVDDLADLDRPAPWWGRLYEALAGADREALAGLPVPLADGRTVRGPRGVVVGADPAVAADLAALGVRVVDPAAGHPLLEALGAVPADPRALLALPAVRSAVEGSLDADRPEEVLAAVLPLVTAAGLAAGDAPWLAALALPDDEGGWSPAGELVLPGSALAGVLEPGALAAVDPAAVARWGEPVLAAVGALATFAVVVDEDLVLDPDVADLDLDAAAEWVERTLDLLPDGDLPPAVPGFRAVRDLDLVAEDRWPQALRLLAGDPVLRAAVVEPARVLLPDGGVAPVPSYSAWWLGEHARLAGRRPGQLLAPGADRTLAGLLPPAPADELAGVDPVFLRALGMVTSPADLAAAPHHLPLVRAGVPVDGTAGPDSEGVPLAVPPGVERVLPDAPTWYVEHDELTVAGVGCDWWVDDAGTVHAATLDGLARGLAWAAGRWDLRLLVAAVLAEPGRVGELLAESAWDPPQPPPSPTVR
jgi:hypothetical protein